MLLGLYFTYVVIRVLVDPKSAPAIDPAEAAKYSPQQQIIMIIKNILPTLFNEFISLLKETSVAGYIALVDITRAGEIVRSRVWSMPPLVVSALIYLTLVLLLTRVQIWMERRLGASDRRL